MIEMGSEECEVGGFNRDNGVLTTVQGHITLPAVELVSHAQKRCIKIGAEA